MEINENSLVVGAGASGLPAIKTALEYGFEVVCMEKSEDIGGLWRYKPHPKPDEGTVMRSTVINTSKEMTAYSDFHLQQKLPTTCIIETCWTTYRTKEFSTTGQWNVTYEDLSTGELGKEVFDGVMMCQGHHSIPHWPAPFAGNHCSRANCLTWVWGIGNSGGDIAVELSKLGVKQSVGQREPSDLVFLNRYAFGIKSLSPLWLQNTIVERKLNQRFDHGRFGIKPEHRFLQAHVTVNDELPNRIISGTVVVKANILKFNQKDVIFEDGSKAENNSLTIIGLIQPTGSIMPISEMQCRVFCAQLAGEVILPEPKFMLTDALASILKNKKRFVDRRRHTLQARLST
uniref:Flavin-containing monooxygenase n=1 Tax=Ditylenchus dipsaci TaxID=166011 RepID=A0A915CL48_9BILA